MKQSYFLANAGEASEPFLLVGSAQEMRKTAQIEVGKLRRAPAARTAVGFLADMIAAMPKKHPHRQKMTQILHIRGLVSLRCTSDHTRGWLMMSLVHTGKREAQVSDQDLFAIGPFLKRQSFLPAARHQSGSRVVDRTLKRSFDLGVALTALIILLPLLILVALAIWVIDGGSPFYSHRRLGRHQTSFGCLKFRTMRVHGQEALTRYLAENPAALAEWNQSRKLKDDPRITPIGRVLRKSSLDELPQLINIVRGEMSIVGPRPIVDAEIEKYGDSASAYFAVRPGLTGAWQISGRSDTSYAERVRLDRQYVESQNFVSDMLIILRTIPAVFLVKGSY